MALTPPPTAALRTMAQAVFDACVAARMAWDAVNVTELDALQLDVSTKQATASSAAATASTAAGVASAAAAAASDSETAAAASAASAAALAGAFVGTSTTSLTVGPGSKVFTTQAGEQYTAGVFMTAVSAADTTNWMFGQVTYSGTTLTMNSTMTGGSGTHADWNLSIAGPQGPAGTTFTGGTMASAINTKRAIVASHATTADIWGALGNEIDFTGTAALTDFPDAPQAGSSRTLHCAGACTFTHNANIFVPGAANFTAAAGDIVTVHAITASTFRLEITKADGTAVSGAAGAARPSSAADIVLTSLSPRVQSITFTAATKSLRLPDATTLQKGYEATLNFEAASLAGAIRDGAGNCITSGEAGQKITLYLVDNVSSAGVWLATLGGTVADLFVGAATVINAASSQWMSAVALSATMGVIGYQDSPAAAFKAVSIDISTGVPVAGVVATIVNAGCSYHRGSRVDNSMAMFVYRVNSTGFLSGITLTVAGSGASATVTPSTARVFTAEDSNYPDVTMLTSTLGMCIYSGATITKAFHFPLTGSVVGVPGTLSDVSNSSHSSSHTSICRVSATRAGVCFQDDVNTNLIVKTLDVSGANVVQAGSTGALTSVSATYPRIALSSASKLLVAWAGTSGYLNLIEYVFNSGGITGATSDQLILNAAVSQFISLGIVSDIKAVCGYYTSGTVKINYVTIGTGSTTLTNSPIKSFASPASAPYLSLASFSANKFVAARAATSNYLNAELVEYTVGV